MKRVNYFLKTISILFINEVNLPPKKFSFAWIGAGRKEFRAVGFEFQDIRAFRFTSRLCYGLPAVLSQWAKII